MNVTPKIDYLVTNTQSRTMQSVEHYLRLVTPDEEFPKHSPYLFRFYQKKSWTSDFIQHCGEGHVDDRWCGHCIL